MTSMQQLNLASAGFGEFKSGAVLNVTYIFKWHEQSRTLYCNKLLSGKVMKNVCSFTTKLTDAICWCLCWLQIWTIRRYSHRSQAVITGCQSQMALELFAQMHCMILCWTAGIVNRKVDQPLSISGPCLKTSTHQLRPVMMNRDRDCLTVSPDDINDCDGNQWATSSFVEVEFQISL